jgi:hypothetical protein
MRQLRTGASRPRFLLVVAAISVITLAASSPIYSAVRGSHATRNAFALPAAAASGTAAPDCSIAAASAAATAAHFGVEPALGRTPINHVICGPFLGSGSQAMAAMVAVPAGCGVSQGWAVFRFAAGVWQLVMHQDNGALRLDAVGSDIRETQGYPRAGDAYCHPSRMRTRIWHWNGTHLVASPWKVTPTAAPADGALKDGFFKTPSGNIVCYHSPGPKDLPRAFLACGITSGLKPAPPRRACQEGGYAGDRVELHATGRVYVPSCAGDPGALVGLPVARLLGYGKRWSGGGFRCVSTYKGLICRNKSGHGFFLSGSRHKFRHDR